MLHFLKLALILILGLTFYNSFGQLQYKTGQLYVSPVINFGAPAIINQNNFGFSEMAYNIKPGGQAGIQFGYDNYLKSSFRFGVLYSHFGQSYSDVLSGLPHKKNITLKYINIPVVYKYVFGDTKRFDFMMVYKYIFGGFQLGYLLDAEIDWERDGKKIDFWDFVSYNGTNPNLDEIMEIGIPDKDRDFFTPIDFSLVGGLGMQYFIGLKMAVFGELNGNIGIRDINSPSWRFRNNKKSYSGSLNFFGGIAIGINYYP
ncbi:MAG: outer membrane beta-barrel protein [Deltaproteobacteria bacterium]